MVSKELTDLRACASRIICGFLLLVVLLAGGVAQAQTHTRQSLQEFVKDQAKVTSLIRAVFVMKQRDSAPKDSADYRKSWEYWASIHGYAGTTSPTGTLQAFQQQLANRFPDDAPLFAGFFTGLQDLVLPSQPPGLAQKVWATCEHDTIHFLSWHRMYLYFFERVLREASGDPNFALPYWDYTNITQDPNDPANAPFRLPLVFAVETLQTTAGPIPNPLFDKRRTSGFGSSVQLDPLLTDVDSTLALGDFESFQSTLDRGLHGFIHCTAGNGCLAPYMGLVPFSANDPIFWVHHANIDRLWECWSVRHGKDKNPIADQSWMNTEFSFVDENGSPVSMKVAELFDPHGRIDYAYDNVTDCFRNPPPAPQFVMALDAAATSGSNNVSTSEVARTENIDITQLDQVVSLNPATQHATETLLFAKRPSVLNPTSAKLRLEGVRLAAEPGASVRVYLSNKGGDKRTFVGVLSFFAIFDHAAHGEGRDFVFDVSTQLQELSAEEATTSAGVDVVLMPSSGLAGETGAVNAKRYQDAGIKIRKIALEVETSARPIDLK